MNKFFAIVLTIFVVLTLVFLVFINNNLIKGDPSILGSYHYLKINQFESSNIEEVDVDTGLATDLWQSNSGIPYYTHTAMFSLYKTDFSANTYNLILYFDIPADIIYSDLDGRSALPYLVYIDMGFGWHSNESNVEIDGFNGIMQFGLTSSGNYLTVDILSPSYFTVKFNSRYFIDTFTDVYDFLALNKPTYSYLDGVFDINDVGMFFADTFYFYPLWVISHITLPFQVLGGVFNW